ncbi:exodeoxyribonuclease VII small subunit [Megalodesulfovibrio paquesii]
MTDPTPRDRYDAQVARLKEVVTALERPDVPLEEAVALYKEGLTLARDCRTRLEQARHEVEQLAREGGEHGASAEEQA